MSRPRQAQPAAAEERRGVPRSANCGELLPWIADDASSYDAVIDASVPVLVDFWAPWCGRAGMSRR